MAICTLPLDRNIWSHSRNWCQQRMLFHQQCPSSSSFRVKLVSVLLSNSITVMHFQSWPKRKTCHGLWIWHALTISSLSVQGSPSGLLYASIRNGYDGRDAEARDCYAFIERKCIFKGCAIGLSSMKAFVGVFFLAMWTCNTRTFSYPRTLLFTLLVYDRSPNRWVDLD